MMWCVFLRSFLAFAFVCACNSFITIAPKSFRLHQSLISSTSSRKKLYEENLLVKDVQKAIFPRKRIALRATNSVRNILSNQQRVDREHETKANVGSKSVSLNSLLQKKVASMSIGAYLMNFFQRMRKLLFSESEMGVSSLCSGEVNSNNVTDDDIFGPDLNDAAVSDLFELRRMSGGNLLHMAILNDNLKEAKKLLQSDGTLATLQDNFSNTRTFVSILLYFLIFIYYFCAIAFVIFCSSFYVFVICLS